MNLIWIKFGNPSLFKMSNCVCHVGKNINYISLDSIPTLQPSDKIIGHQKKLNKTFQPLQR